MTAEQLIRKRINAQHREQRERRKKAGLCIVCGKPAEIKADGTYYVNCPACKAKRKKEKQDRIERGICIVCGKKADIGHKTCKKCRELGAEKLRERKKKQREEAKRNES